MKGTQDTMEGGHKVIVEMPENLLLYDFFARLENLEKIVHNQGKTAKKQNRFVKKLTLVVSVVVIALLFMAGLLAVVLYKDSSCTCRAGYPVDLERAEGPGASGARAGGPPGEDGGPPGEGDGKPPGSDPDHRVPTGIDGILFKHRENDVKRIKRSADDGSQVVNLEEGVVDTREVENSRFDLLTSLNQRKKRSAQSNQGGAAVRHRKSKKGRRPRKKHRHRSKRSTESPQLNTTAVLGSAVIAQPDRPVQPVAQNPLQPIGPVQPAQQIAQPQGQPAQQAQPVPAQPAGPCPNSASPTSPPALPVRLPIFHMEAQDVRSETNPLQNVNTYNIYKYWRTDQHISDTSLAQMSPSDGRLVIKKSGIYLVYAQVIFHSSLKYDGLAIRVNGNVKMRCFQHGPPRVNNTSDPEYNAIFSTCNPMQTMYLNDYDSVTVTSLHNHSWAYFYPDTAYWGIILLNEIEIPALRSTPIPSTPVPATPVPAQ